MDISAQDITKNYNKNKNFVWLIVVVIILFCFCLYWMSNLNQNYIPTPYVIPTGNYAMREHLNQNGIFSSNKCNPPCNAPYTCKDNQCVISCFSDKICPQGSVCLDGICANPTVNNLQTNLLRSRCEKLPNPQYPDGGYICKCGDYKYSEMGSYDTKGVCYSCVSMTPGLVDECPGPCPKC